MGSVWTLSVGSTEVFSDKYEIPHYLLTLFRKQDQMRIRFPRSRNLGNYRLHYCYICKLRNIIQRLEIMGFSFQRAKDELKRNDGIETDGMRSRSEIMAAATALPESESHSDSMPYSHGTNFGNPTDSSSIVHSDIRYALRILFENYDPNQHVILDYTDQVHYNTYGEAELNDLVETALVSLTRGISNDRIIVLTEGESDTKILKECIYLRYPHLSDFYTFLNFSSDPSSTTTTGHLPGGALALRSHVRSFIGAHIRNRTIAIFDNDLEGWQARQEFDNTKMPDNVKIIMLPDLRFSENYPVKMKNQPIAYLNANRNGCAIEMYLGQNVLHENGTLLPLDGGNQINWKFSDRVKRRVQDKFWKSVKTRSASHDWSGIEQILQLIFSAFA